MARSLNKVMLIGNLGKDPEVRHLENGTAVANFSIATSESYKDRNSGETITNTDWHNVVVWRGLADVAEKYLKKGDKVSLIGFGTWSVSKRAARTGRNPQTGKTIQIAAKNVVKFKAGSELAKTVN